MNALEVVSNYARPYYIIGRCLCEEQNYKEAERYFRKAISANRFYSPAYN